jgi:general stress protein YciG
MANQESITNAQPTNTSSKWNGTEADQGAPRKRGFGAMDRKEVRELARKGGVAAHRAGTAHEFSSEEARLAGRKGGLATHAGRREHAEAAVTPPTPPTPNKMS